MSTENPAFDKWWRSKDITIKRLAIRKDLALLAFTAGETNGIRKSKVIVGEYIKTEEN